MTTVGLRAAWEVRVGVIPGTPMPEHTKRWFYTSEDYETDQKNANDKKPVNVFTSKLIEAHDYAMAMSNPANVNWVETSFVWY